MRLRSRSATHVLWLLAASGCNWSSSIEPIGDYVPEASVLDATSPDAGARDATARDAYVPDTYAPDTGIATVDGATLDATAAPEASLPDAAVDASVDAAAAPVAILVTNDLGPEPGVLVVFQDATGAVMSTATTDTSGRAVQVVPAGSQVTVVMGTETAPSLLTIQGVEPGDGLSAYDPGDTTVSGAKVTNGPLPDISSPPYSQNESLAIGPCQGDVGSTIALNTQCESGGVFPALVIDYGGSGTYGPIGYMYQNDNTIPVDGGTVTVTMTGTWLTPGSETVSAIHVPTSLTPTLTLGNIAEGVAVSFSIPPSVGDDGSASASLTTFPGYATSLQTEMSFNETVDGAEFSQAVTAIATASAPDAGAAPIDFDAMLPPYASVSADTTTDPTRPAVSFVTGSPDGGPLATADGTAVVFTWNTDSTIYANGQWTVIAPPTATSVKAPALPSSATNFAPFAESAFGDPAVVTVQASFLSGYAAFRASAAQPPASAALIGGDRSQPAIPPLPVGQTVVLTAIVPVTE